MISHMYIYKIQKYCKKTVNEYVNISLDNPKAQITIQYKEFKCNS